MATCELEQHSDWLKEVLQPPPRPLCKALAGSQPLCFHFFTSVAHMVPAHCQEETLTNVQVPA